MSDFVSTIVTFLRYALAFLADLARGARYLYVRRPLRRAATYLRCLPLARTKGFRGYVDFSKFVIELAERGIWTDRFLGWYRLNLLRMLARPFSKVVVSERLFCCDTGYFSRDREWRSGWSAFLYFADPRWSDASDGPASFRVLRGEALEWFRFEQMQGLTIY